MPNLIFCLLITFVSILIYFSTLDFARIIFNKPTNGSKLAARRSQLKARSSQLAASTCPPPYQPSS
jgi:hypothetical protein